MLRRSFAVLCCQLRHSYSRRSQDYYHPRKQQKDIMSPSREELLGGEAHLLDADVEIKGVEAMMADLTSEEKASLADPSMPMRFFRKEKGNTKKALESLRTTLEWRNEFGVEKIVQATQPGSGDNAEMLKILQQENETGKTYVRGYDKHGRALIYMRGDRENTNNETNNMRSLVWNLEKGIACTRRKSKEIGSSPMGLEKMILIMDFSKFSLASAPPMSTSKHTLTILQSHYPERVKTIYCFNAPFVFKAFWAMVKHFVDPVTKQKIVFVSGAKGMAEFHEIFNEDGVKALEQVCGGPLPNSSPEDWDGSAYLSLPFDTSFGEKRFN